jgi:hypothetical protein
MAAKNSSKPKLGTVPKRDWRGDLQEDIRDRNYLIGLGADETMSMCADVLAFVCDFHLRTSHDELEEDVDHGEYLVLRVVQDALNMQANVTTQSIPPKEVANG